MSNQVGSTKPARCPPLANIKVPIVITASHTCDNLVNYTTLDTAIGTNVGVECMYTCIWYTGTAYGGRSICGADGKWTPSPPFCKQQPPLPPSTAAPISDPAMHAIYAMSLLAGVALFVLITVCLLFLWRRRKRDLEDSRNKCYRGNHSLHSSDEHLHGDDLADGAANESGYFGENIATSFPSPKAFNLPQSVYGVWSNGQIVIDRGDSVPEQQLPPSSIGNQTHFYRTSFRESLSPNATPIESILNGNLEHSSSWLNMTSDEGLKLPRPDISLKFRDLWQGSHASAPDYADM